MGQWPRRREGKQRPICDLAPLAAGTMFGWARAGVLPAPHRGMQVLADAMGRGEVGLEAAVVLFLMISELHCVILESAPKGTG